MVSLKRWERLKINKKEKKTVLDKWKFILENDILTIEKINGKYYLYYTGKGVYSYPFESYKKAYTTAKRFMNRKKRKDMLC